MGNARKAAGLHSEVNGCRRNSSGLFEWKAEPAGLSQSRVFTWKSRWQTNYGSSGLVSARLFLENPGDELGVSRLTMDSIDCLWSNTSFQEKMRILGKRYQPPYTWPCLLYFLDELKWCYYWMKYFDIVPWHVSAFGRSVSFSEMLFTKWRICDVKKSFMGEWPIHSTR